MNPKYLKRPLLTLIVGLVLTAACCFGIYYIFQPTKYEKNGTEVSFTVVSVKQHAKLRQEVTVVYINDNGVEMTAQATMNRLVSEGDEFTGLILPDEPGKVYCPADISLKLILAGLVAVICVFEIYFIFCSAAYMASQKKLAKHGVRVTAEILSFTLLQKNIYDVKVSFKDENDEEQTAEFTLTKIRPHSGQRIDILYYRKGSGKFICTLA